MQQHLTVDTFLVHEGKTAYHWHRKNQMWLPAGGHIEPGEDPASAALREIREEFAIEAAIMRVEYEGGPVQIEPPVTILDCWDAPDHRHISLVYFCQLISGFPGRSYEPLSPVRWFDVEALGRGSAESGGREAAFTPDVQRLGLEALERAETFLKTGAA